MNKLKLSIAGGLLFLVSLLIGTSAPIQKLAGVDIANEYQATSTITNFIVIRDINNGNATATPTTLGSVIITTAGTSPFCIHDATSTKTNAEWATTTVACFQASAGLGTYSFDARLQKGILLEFTGSPSATSRPSTTITWR